MLSLRNQSGFTLASHREAGFTLLEIMITVVIFVGALFPILNLYSSGFLGTSDSEITTIALNYARGKMERIKNFDDIDYDDVEVGTERIEIGEFTLYDVNLSLSDPTFTKEGIITFVQVVNVDENNNKVLSETGLKKVITSSFSREKDGRILKRIEFITIISG